MILTNNEIYNYAACLTTFNINTRIPVRINFFLQKNIQTIIKAAQEIDANKISILKQFGVINQDGTAYEIPPENTEIVNKELNDLFTIKQDLNIHIFNLKDFDNINLEYQELSAIMFMIEE